MPFIDACVLTAGIIWIGTAIPVAHVGPLIIGAVVIGLAVWQS